MWGGILIPILRQKKPVVIEAFQFDDDLIDCNGKYYVLECATEAYENGTIYFAYT